MTQRIAIVSVLLLVISIGRAQTTNASIYGSILDSSGAAVPKASVTALNLRTGVALSTASNDSGIYIFPSLLPGEYSVSAEAAGFRKALSLGIQLDVASRISVDLKLEVGTAAETVTVESSSSALEAVNSSVSNVVSLQKVQNLPLQSLDAGGLIALQPGVIGDNINGVRSQSQNVMLDGMNIQETRYNGGYTANATAAAAVDLVAEFRVSTAPVDAEFGRGMAQVQMISRSGTNEVHGSAFETNRVTALSANSWFNNQLGRKPDGSLAAPRNFLIRNQFGVRAGGPIIKNRTFAFFLYEGQRQKNNSAINDTVLTATARQGTFRFFPGLQNGNATAAVPTVDLNGNPVQPAAATGPLQSVSIFGRDPNRLMADTTGNVALALKDVPLPNNFQRGDGLNTAGYYWQQPSTNNFNLYDFKIDHILTQTTRLAFSGQIKKVFSFNGYRGQVYPLQPSDTAFNSNFLYTFAATTNIRPTLLNEFRAGVNYFEAGYSGPFYPDQSSVLPHIGNQPFFFTFLSVSNEYTSNNAPQGRTSPLYQVADSVTWLKGRHAFKGGIQVYFDSSNGYNSFSVLPGATIGAGSAAVSNISTITGIGGNLTAAQNLLLDLSGSLTNWTQAFNSAGGLHPTYIPGENNRRDWRQHEYSGFFKDDWKLNQRLTLNLGVRYEYYSPPFEPNGRAVVPANGSAGAFGISGTSYASAFQPGATGGSLTQLVLVGPRSPNPNGKIYNAQYNTVLPGAGLSWSIDQSNKTIFRAGYAMSSDRNSLRNADTEVGSNPGMNTTIAFQSGGVLNLSNVGVPFDPGQAMATVPLTDRTQTLRVFDTGLRNQYYQNWNVSLQREITRDSILSVRLVGTKGTRLLSGVNLNTDVITSNGILNAFNITRTGGQAPLFDQLFAGLTISGQGAVNGTTVRGSDYARSNSTIAGYLANGNVGAFANFINTTATGTNVNGGLLTAAGLPQNFIVTNPQFANVYLVGNNANSTYNALQVEYDKRFTKGFTYQGSYTWSKALGESELGSTQYYDNNYRNPQNRSFDKRIMTFNRTSVFKSNGIYELPFGKGRAMLSNANRLVDGVLGGWRLAGILTWTSGVPFTVTAPVSTFNQFTTGQTPDVTGALSKATGQLQFNGTGACFFCGFKQIPDPSIAGLTASIASRSTLFAQVAPSGTILQNPLPGTLGNLAQTFFTSPNFFNFDASLSKTFRITERFNFELRTDWLNSTNHQDFSNATIDSSIDSATFGRFTGGGNANRIIVLGGRLNW